MLPEVDQDLALVQRQLLVEGVVLVVEVEKVLEMFPKLGINLMALAQVDWIRLRLHHLVHIFLLRATALRSRPIQLLLHLLAGNLSSLV